MERLLVVKAEVRECDAEVMLNGIPLARLSAARPSAIVPVHVFGGSAVWRCGNPWCFNLTRAHFPGCDGGVDAGP